MQDVWHVRLESGEVRDMTLDELDAAYQAGAIDERTLVREDGGEWQTLGTLLGVEAEAHGASLRPMATDLEDLDEHHLRPKRRGVLVGAAIAAALVIGGVALAVTKVGSAPDAPKAAAAAVNLPAAIAVSPPADPEGTPGDRLTDEQKRALSQKDKDLAAKAAKAREERDSKQRFLRPATKSGPVFHQGGDPHDPLNAKL
jgi:hypothetical protein